MSYIYDIFISYKRTSSASKWVENCFHPCLKERLEDELGSIKISFDKDMDDGVNLTEELKERIRRSKLLVAVWSAPYFRSKWCMAEWESFRQREKHCGLFKEHNPKGLIYPVRYADGDAFHPDTKDYLIKKDFSEFTYSGDFFKHSAQFLDFENLIKQMAKDLIIKLNEVPQWKEDFPISEPEPLEPVPNKRPTL